LQAEGVLGGLTRRVSRSAGRRARALPGVVVE